jgi:aminoglycoside 3-N-acetyltransferase
MSKHVTFHDIVKALRSIGLTKGDKVMVHSALSSFGKVKGGPDTVIDAILEIVSPSGTVIIPTFGNSDKVFDPLKSETNLGIIAQTFWKRKNAVRSKHPAASIAAIGLEAEYFTINHENCATAHGENTPYMRLVQQGGKVLLLGVDLDRMTLLHSVETLAKSPYLRPITKSYVDAKGKTQTKTWNYFPGPHRNFIKLQSWLGNQGLIKETSMGSCCAKIINAADLFSVLEKRIKIEPDLFISNNPNLPDGIWQRADILKTFWENQTFTLAADSQFAGKYIEEVIENCKSAGIENVVLSFINDTRWDAIDTKTRRWYLQGLKNSNIKVAAIRISLNSIENYDKLISEASTNTIIVPSTIPKSKYPKKRVNILIENDRIGSVDFVKQLKTKAAFNPLAFVEAGENPFLESYSKRSIKSKIGALFINDGFASGKRTAFEEGLAEIKELISILLCRNFDGLFILQARDSNDFKKSCDKFREIIEEIK